MIYSRISSRFALEWVEELNRNRWKPNSGMGGRIESEWVETFTGIRRFTKKYLTG
jgi:hypothetical protein